MAAVVTARVGVAAAAAVALVVAGASAAAVVAAGDWAWATAAAGAAGAAMGRPACTAGAAAGVIQSLRIPGWPSAGAAAGTRPTTPGAWVTGPTTLPRLQSGTTGCPPSAG